MEELIKIINYIDNNFDYIDIDELYMNDDYITIFNKLSDMLDSINLDNNMLHMISKIDKKEIFYQEIGTKFINNPNRKKILEYLENDKLFLDYELVKRYIKDNYKLANYLKDKSKILDLVDINEKVILLLPVEYLTEEFILNRMNKSNFITEVFLGLYEECNLYNYSLFYRNNKEINNLLYNQSKKYLESDIYIYIHSSDLVKNNIDIAKLILSINPLFKHYISDIIKDDIN